MGMNSITLFHLFYDVANACARKVFGVGDYWYLFSPIKNVTHYVMGCQRVVVKVFFFSVRLFFGNQILLTSSLTFDIGYDQGVMSGIVSRLMG